MAEHDSFLDAFLEANPDILFQAMRPQSGPPSFVDYFRGRQPQVLGNYLGSLGRAALAGEAPTQTLQSYLGAYPWLQRWQGLSPSQRGDQSSRFAPRLRFNF